MCQRSSYTRYMLIWDNFVFINFNKLQKIAFFYHLSPQIKQNILFPYNKLLSSGVSRTLLNIYDRAFLQKQSMALRR